MAIPSCLYCLLTTTGITFASEALTYFAVYSKPTYRAKAAELDETIDKLEDVMQTPAYYTLEGRNSAENLNKLAQKQRGELSRFNTALRLGIGLIFFLVALMLRQPFSSTPVALSPLPKMLSQIPLVRGKFESGWITYVFYMMLINFGVRRMLPTLLGTSLRALPPAGRYERIMTERRAETAGKGVFASAFEQAKLARSM